MKLSAEVYITECQSVTGGFAPGIAAEMIFGMGRMRYAGTCKVVFAGAYRIRPTAMDAKNHCSGKPDGAAGNNSDDGDMIGHGFLRRLEASPPSPRRGAQIKK